MVRIGLKAIGVVVMLGCGAALAEANDATPLLVVDQGSDQPAHSYSRATLAAMRQVSFRTSTIWTEGVREFRGVPLSEVLKDAGVATGQLILRASNDYAAEIPVSSVLPDVPIIALTIDGEPMTRRDKGPLWVVYPYDMATVYQSEVIYTRSVWQLVTIEVVP
jgi:hypothetical protein